LRNGLSPLPAADLTTRRRLENELREQGLDALHRRLTQLDPVAGARIHRTDPQRIQRALEVIEITGSTLTELHARDGGVPCPYPVHAFSLEPRQRAWLHQRIAQRFDAMLRAGFEDEVRDLRRKHRLSADLPAVRAVGYRQMHAFLDGELDHASMLMRAVVATRQLARRQLTWLRSESVQRRIAADSNDAFVQLRSAVRQSLQSAC